MTLYDLPNLAAVNVASCKPSIVKVILPHHGTKTVDLPVLQSDSGSLYEVSALIRSTRLGSVHRVFRLTKIPNTDIFARCGEPLAVKTYNKRALMALQMKMCEENPVNEMIALSIFSQQGGHSNLLEVLELFSDAEFFYMIMPFMSGGDLLDVMEQSKEQGMTQRLPIPVAKQMFRDVLLGLKHLHDNGIAHRDLSLENILYDEATDKFVVIDLGMCIRLPRDEDGQFRSIPARPICGKRNYIAPEVWAQQAWFDPVRCDIWSAGVVLYMALTACAPLDQATMSDPHYAAIARNRLIDVLVATFQHQEGWDQAEATFEETLQAMDPELVRAMELLQPMLSPDPRLRPTIEEILAHPWLA